MNDKLKLIRDKLKLIREFLDDLVWATKGIPAEAVRQWHQAHRWDRDEGDFVCSYDTLPSGGQTATMAWKEDPDYTMWKRLGWATDAILTVIVLAIIFLIVAGVFL